MKSLAGWWSAFLSRFAVVERQVGSVVGHAEMNALVLADFTERSLLLQGSMAARSLPRDRRLRDLAEAEFRVFSQWGEDGILEWLCQTLQLPGSRFVEFGVETFREANCRFLMHNRNWKGLVIDGSAENMAGLKQQPWFWKHDLTAVAAFVTRDNIDKLIAEAGFSGPLGILSIDIDGNDYWVWDAIHSVDPAIVVCECNPILGDTRALTVPYDARATRFERHASGLYFGASIKALQHCARRKSYTFVGTGLQGINAFFVRDDLAGRVTDRLERLKAYPSRHRDSRDRQGNLSYAAGLDRLALIADMPVVDVETDETVRLGSIERPYSDAWLAEML